MDRDRFAKLKEVGEPMRFRASELKDRPAAVKAAEAFAELAGKSASSWKDAKPWLNATELQSFADQASPISRVTFKHASRIGIPTSMPVF